MCAVCMHESKDLGLHSLNPFSNLYQYYSCVKSTCFVLHGCSFTVLCVCIVPIMYATRFVKGTFKHTKFGQF